MKALLGTAILTLLVGSVDASPSAAALGCSSCESLPGVAVPFVLQVTNGSSKPITVPRWAVAYVRTASSSDVKIVGTHGKQTHNLIPDGEDPPVVASDGRATIDIGMSVGLSGPWFYVDPRISQPGEYEIWLALYDDDFQCEGCVPGVVPEPRLVTTPARLVVRTPSGADASIWKLMQEQTCESGFWTPGCLTQARSVIDVIVRDHRDSGYFPYAAALKRVHEREARIAMLEDVIARHPTTVLRGFLEWRLSIDYYSAANDAELRQNDHAAAARLRTIHSRYLRSALTGTLPPDVRKKATEQLEGESRPTE